jgi:tRNA threonylcarbamoyladenosine biosynthesis protein TsaB
VLHPTNAVSPGLIYARGQWTYSKGMFGPVRPLKREPMNDDRIIAIETSSPLGSVAIGQGPELVAEREFSTQTQHGRELLPTLDALCREHGWGPETFSFCFVSIGPGSFTGLRVAVTFARILALARHVRICAVPTLMVIVENCLSLPTLPQWPAVILDAKRSQVFGGVFELAADRYRAIVPAILASPEGILCGNPGPTAVMGEGIEYHRAAVDASGLTIIDPVHWRPRAAMVHRVGWRMASEGHFTPPRALIPHYIRRPEAEELWEKRQAAR